MTTFAALLLTACRRGALEEGEDSALTTSPPIDTSSPADTSSTSTTSPTNTAPGGLHLPDWRGMDLVVLHVDALRADTLPGWGSPYDTLPLTRSRAWLRVHGDVASAPWTGPSTASALTGVSPHRHGVRHVTSGDEPREQIQVATFPPLYAAAGYATALVTGNAVLTGNTSFTDPFEAAYHHHKEAWVSNQGEAVVTASEWIDGLDPGTPYLLWFQPMDVHAPYCPDALDDGAFIASSEVPFAPEGTEAEQKAAIEAAYEAASAAEADALTAVIRAFYAEQVLGVDRALEAFLAHLEATGRFDRTVVVLTSDHGETLNDRDSRRFEHGGDVTPELVQVPLLIFGRGLAAGEVTCAMENADLFPTLARAMGIAAPDGVEGQALQDGCRSWTRSAWYGPMETILGVQSPAAQLVLDCVDTTVTGHDLVADPTGGTAVDPAALPDGEAGLELLAAFADEVTAHTGDVFCAMP